MTWVAVSFAALLRLLVRSLKQHILKTVSSQDMIWQYSELYNITNLESCLHNSFRIHSLFLKASA